VNFLLIKALIRFAKTQPDPAAWLNSIISGAFTITTKNGGRVMTSTSMNGSQFSYQILAGLGPKEIIGLATLALEYLEAGITPSRKIVPSFR
jgi:hypothetical protein